MTLSIDELNQHYLDVREMIQFFFMAFICMLLSVIILKAAAKKAGLRAAETSSRRHQNKRNNKKLSKAGEWDLDGSIDEDYDMDKADIDWSKSGRNGSPHKGFLRETGKIISGKTTWLTQAFYEMMFSDTCILGFIGTYVILDWFVTKPVIRNFWDSYSDFILLGLIILSTVVNTFLDHVFINLREISREEKASIRLIGMLYMGIIFLYIKFVYQDNNYDRIIVYYLGLMVGRFVYFDASFHDFKNSVRDAFRNLPIMLLALADTAAMAAYGFWEGYLLKVNGVVVSLLIAHLYMLICLFIIHHLHIDRYHLSKRHPESTL